VPNNATSIDVRLREVTHSYGEISVLQDVTLTIPPHHSCAIVGPSGCGKSTLLSLVAGLIEPVSGHISVGGATQPEERIARSVLMPQKDLLLPWLRAIDNAGLAIEIHGRSRREARSTVAPLFERFGLNGFERKWPHELSGGMRQRVGFLRTLAAGKDVVLLDEPFGALDAITRADMQSWLREVLRAEPRTILLVTHDVEEALLLCEQLVVLTPRPGRVARCVPVNLPGFSSRAEAVADTDFTALRREVMKILEGQ
jgi:NitT/TauT family transport system ATP-binding protein